jgi:hypothetical protein
VTVSKLGHENNGVKTGVFGKSVGDQFKSLTISAANVGVGSENSSRVDLELMGNFHLDTGTSRNEGSFLDKSTNDTEGIMERTVSFLENESIGTAKKDRHGLALVGAAKDLYHLVCSSS